MIWYTSLTVHGFLLSILLDPSNIVASKGIEGQLGDRLLEDGLRFDVLRDLSNLVFSLNALL